MIFLLILVIVLAGSMVLLNTIGALLVDNIATFLACTLNASVFVGVTIIAAICLHRAW